MESRQRTKGLAPRALAQELRRKGIADDEAKAALEQIDDDDQRLAARALVDKKLRTLRNVDRATATRRLAGLLARKGYSSGLAFSVVREALGERDDEDAAGDSGPRRPLRRSLRPDARTLSARGVRRGLGMMAP